MSLTVEKKNSSAGAEAPALNGGMDDEHWPLKLGFQPNFDVLNTMATGVGMDTTKIHSIEFEDVNYKRKDIQVLSGVSSRTRPGQMLTILGPSHAGKTKLLNVLAGTVQSSRQTQQVLSGVFIANESLQYYSVLRVGFVPKTDHVFAASTVREELEFSSALRLPRSVPKQERARLVKEILSGLGLDSVSSTLVKHLSKFHKKLLAIGIGLVTLPNVLCLDEPTSGLDPTAQWELIQVLNALAQSKACVVIAALQQPSSQVFSSLTHTLVLSKGQVIYDGLAADMSNWLTTKMGFNPAQVAIQQKQSPGDVMLACARSLPLDRFIAQQQPSSALSSGAEDTSNNNNTKKGLMNKKQSVIPMITNDQVKQFIHRPRHETVLVEFWTLLKRDVKATKRDPRLLLGRVVLTCLIFTLCACVFLHAGDTSSPSYFIGSHFASFVFTMFTSCFGVMIPTILFLFEVKGVFIRERALNMYGAIPFALSKLLVELFVNFFIAILCVLLMYWSAQWHGSFIMIVVAYYLLILSCLSWAYFLALAIPSAGAAVGLVALVLVPQLLFMGTFVRIGSLPIWLQWVSYVCNITYALRFVTVVEFDAENCGKNPIVCAQWAGIQSTNLTYKDELWLYAVILVVFIFVLRALGFLKIRNNIVHAKRFGEL